MTNNQRNPMWRLHQSGVPPAQISAVTGLASKNIELGLRDSSPEEIERLKKMIRSENGMLSEVVT